MNVATTLGLPSAAAFAEVKTTVSGMLSRQQKRKPDTDNGLNFSS
jgi:hypothetical protein